MSLSLYIHIPYCLEKCPYCDFHSVAVSREELPYQRYAEALVRQIEKDMERFGIAGKKIKTIFFGGGTPSLMPPHFFETIFKKLQADFVWDDAIEITIEANPATVDVAKLSAIRKLGVNRLSIGAQSFQDPLLKKLGRSHSGEQALAAYRIAREAEIKNVSLDLIFGIEGETLADLENDLEMAASLNPEHLSVYQLTVESNTPLASWVKQGKFFLPEEEILVQMHELVPQTLAKYGLQRYEISNYSKPGFESQHNLQYWRYQNYWGLGSGAYSFLNARRWRTTRSIKKFLNHDFEEEDIECVDPKMALKEKWMMGLRLTEGVRWGTEEAGWIASLNPWKDQGKLEIVSGRVRLTEEGMLVTNRIIENIFDLIDQVCYEQPQYDTSSAQRLGL